MSGARAADVDRAHPRFAAFTAIPALLAPLALLLALASGCDRPASDPVDLAVPRLASFDCAGRADCWPVIDRATGWTGAGNALQSPTLRVRDGGSLVVRLQSPAPVSVTWIGRTGSRVLRRLTPATGWSPQLFAVALPPGEEGRVRLAHAETMRSSGKRPQVTFAEVVGRDHGRCYRDAYRANRRLLDAVVCVPPATAVLAVPSPAVAALRIAALGTADQSAHPAAMLRIGWPTSDGFVELARLEPGHPGTWHEEVVRLPRVANPPRRLHVRIDGNDVERLVVWSPHFIRSASGPKQPNVILYLVDTLRADALGTYGAAHTASPHIDAVARKGVVFETAMAPASWTLPSVASLFTGLNVLEHGVVYDRDVLPMDVATLAERFRDTGYTTAAVTASLWVSDRHATHRGFREVVDVSPGRGPWGIAAGTSSAAANEVALPWIEEHASEPFFLYVHVIDPHQPYTPPDEQASALADVEWAADDPRWRIARGPSDGRGARRLSIVEHMDPTDAAPIVAVSHRLYAAAVSHCDRRFGELVHTLEQTGLLHRTLIVVTADHGEEFLEHRLTGHAHSLYREVTHVPLIMAYPGAIPEGGRVRQPVSLIDVAPTILALAALSPAPAMAGRDLRPLMMNVPNASPATPRPIFMLHRPQRKGRGVPEIPEMDGVVDGQWKLIRNLGPAPQRPPWELFDRLSDPVEQVNRAARQPQTVARLRALLEATPHVQREGAAARAADVDEATKKRLRALGYSAE
jgi:arylsulfatase A-like enzyme